MPPAKRHRIFHAKRLNRNEFAVKAAGVATALCALVYGSSAVLAERLTLPQQLRAMNERYFPEYEPNGMRVGDFEFLPSVTNGLRFTDNVYAAGSDEQSDIIYTLAPELNIRSDFARHRLDIRLASESGYYRDNDTEDYDDYVGRVSGFLGVAGDMTVPFEFSYAREHYDREVEDERIGAEPTVFDLMESSLGFVSEGQSIVTKAIASVERYVFQDNTSLIGEIDNSDRDRSEYNLYTSLGMAEEAVIAPFVYASLTDIVYDRERDNTGFARGSFNYEIGAGSVVNLSDITRAVFNIGYNNRDPDDTRFSNKDNVTYSANLIWEPSTLASFFLDASRSTEETITVGSSFVTRTDIEFRMNYELFPNVILQPFAGYTDQDFDGIDRQVESMNTGLQMTYKLNQNLWLSSSYRYINQTEKGVDAIRDDYDSNTVNLSLRLQF